MCHSFCLIPEGIYVLIFIAFISVKATRSQCNSTLIKATAGTFTGNLWRDCVPFLPPETPPAFIQDWWFFKMVKRCGQTGCGWGEDLVKSSCGWGHLVATRSLCWYIITAVWTDQVQEMLKKINQNYKKVKNTVNGSKQSSPDLDVRPWWKHRHWWSPRTFSWSSRNWKYPNWRVAQVIVLKSQILISILILNSLFQHNCVPWM